MNFLEARSVVAASKNLPELPLLVGMSGTPHQIEVFVRAHAAKRGVSLLPRFLPFGTLPQTLLQTPEPGLAEVFLMMPWDLAPECDWRVGLGQQLSDTDALIGHAEAVIRSLVARKLARFAYLPAPIPPILPQYSAAAAFAAAIQRLAAENGAVILSPGFFSLSTYLHTGCPIAGAQLTAVAEQLVELVLSPPPGAAKVLVSDLDNTLWAGIVGEDGPENVAAEPEGRTYRHFIFQIALRRLKAQGALLAAVSRNDEDLARAPLSRGQMPLRDDDFVAIRASYGSKSEQMRDLAKILDLGLDSFVFVDDNPVELAEVKSSLPQVVCLPFPAHEEGLPALLDRLVRLFSRQALTPEDAERTELYRRRVASVPPPDCEGNKIEAFLKGLDMVLTVRDVSQGGWSRAHQLINKTNQFNLNGVRLTEDETGAMLNAGGQLLTARLDDRTGTHGEIIACMIDARGRVCSFVMSCRVLQRRVEYAFLFWLAGCCRNLTFAFRPTERNEPFQRFLADPAFRLEEPDCLFDAYAFIDKHRSDAALFTIREETRDQAGTDLGDAACACQVP
jgi:FkbH-like protein